MAGGVEAGLINILISPKLVEGFAKTLGIDLSSETGKAGEKAGENLGKKIGEGFQKTGKQLSKTVTAPIVAGFTAIITAGLKTDEAFDIITAKTGATGEKALELQGIFENLAKNVVGSFNTMADTVSQFAVRGFDPKNIESVATSILQLNKVTGQTLDTDTFIDVLKLFDIKEADAAELLNQIFRASQSSGVSVGQLTSALKLNATTVKELGFNYVDTIALISGLEKEGINAQQVLTGIRRGYLKQAGATSEVAKAQEELVSLQEKELSIRNDLEIAQLKLNKAQIVKTDKSGKQLPTDEIAIKEQQNKIEELTLAYNINSQAILDNQNFLAKASEQNKKATNNFVLDSIAQIKKLQEEGLDQEATALSKKLFGRQALDILEAIKSGAFNIQELSKNIEFGKNTIEAAYFAVIDFPDQLALFRNRLGVALGPIGREIFPVIEKAIATVLPLFEKLVDVFKKLPDGAQTVIVVLLGIAALIGPLLVQVGYLITGFSTLSKTNIGLGLSAKGAAAGFITLRTVLISLGIGLIIAAVVALIQNWDTIKPKVIEAGKAIADFFSGLYNNLVEATTALFTWITDTGSAVLQGISNIYNSIKDGVINFVTETSNSIANTVSSIGESIKNFASGIGNAINQFLVSPIYNFIKGFLEAVMLFERQYFALLKVIITFLKSNFAELKSFGSNVINAFKVVANTLKTEIGKIATGILNRVLDIGKLIASPFINGFRIISSFFSTVLSFIINTVTAIRNLIVSIPSILSGLYNSPIFKAIVQAISIIVGGKFKVAGNILKGVASVFGRENGGFVRSNKPYIVGERGPELFVPNANGSIIPNNMSGSNGQAVYNITINNPVAETSAISIPAALRKANLLRGY